MKLAEALVLRADSKKRIEQLRARLMASALVQEGEQPPEDPGMLFSDLTDMLEQFTRLVEGINRTNLEAALPNGTKLTSALAERDRLTLHHSVLSSVANAATPSIDRLGRAEIRKVPTVKVSDLRRQLDDIAKERRELDTVIQATNWATDLLE